MGELDYGDLPSPYPTENDDNGARHQLVAGGPILGFIVDPKDDGQPDNLAQGDDYELPDLPPVDKDGVTGTQADLKPGVQHTLMV